MTITIKFEEELRDWFKSNYTRLGFARIEIEQTRCPDFVMITGDGLRVRVELETVSSNFILHKHKPSQVDCVICVKKDVELEVDVVELERTYDLKYCGTVTIKVSSDVLAMIHEARGELMAKYKRDISVGEAVRMVIDGYWDARQQKKV